MKTKTSLEICNSNTNLLREARSYLVVFGLYYVELYQTIDFLILNLLIDATVPVPYLSQIICHNLVLMPPLAIELLLNV